MFFLSYWESLLIFDIGNEDSTKDIHRYYGCCIGIINVGLSP